MGADEDVDAVDLVQAEPVQRAPERSPAGHRPPRHAEALRGQRDPAGGGERKNVGAHHARKGDTYFFAKKYVSPLLRTASRP
jgi:hypothetical protein